MKKIRNLLMLLPLALFSIILTSCFGNGKDNANYIYVAADAAETGTGEKSSPMPFDVAVRNAKADDVFLLADGVYSYKLKINLVRSGSPNHYITIKRENENGNVTFDFSEMEFFSTNRGIQLYGNFWHIDGIDIRGAGDNGLYVSGSYNIIENCQFYDNRDSGLQLGRAYSSDKTIDTWPHYNLIKNCTAFANFDDETYGENADGFAAKLTVGYGNVFDGCIAYRNSDDGWDLYAKEDSGNIGTVIINNCVSFENGYLPYKIEREGTREDGSTYTYMSYNTLNGDGIGYKLGGSSMQGDVIITNSLAFNNKLHGISDNSNPGVISAKNCTTFNNCIGLDDDGKVLERGIAEAANKSNNIDLARNSNSYNNYYGLVSYINNQANFNPNGENTYNEDYYRGSCAYSIFQTEYNEGEVYRAFYDYTDASIYQAPLLDAAFSKGEIYEGMNDTMFADLSPINAICDTREDLVSLLTLDSQYRNPDMSVNMGDKLKIVGQELLTFANGKPIGHNLSKSSYDEYEHTQMPDLTKCTTRDEVKVEAAKNFLEVLTNADACYQDFEIAKRILGCEITWESDNTDVIVINDEEEISGSVSVFVTALVTTPPQATKVKLTATITCGDAKSTKEFEVNVRSRNQTLGQIVNDGSSSIRVNKFEEYVKPYIYATDASSCTGSPLAANLYDITYKYQYATDRNSKYYDVSGVYSSVSGVYKVTATVTSKIPSDNGKSDSTVYYVYIVDKECDIDFVNSENTFALIKDGFSVSGELSNILGRVYAVASPIELTLTPDQLMNHKNVQTYDIETDKITANFLADNNAAQKYYVYYVVSNFNQTKVSKVYNQFVDVATISTREEFVSLATTGKIAGHASGESIIYSLTNDLDFSDYTWAIPSSVGSFGSLFNGNGHTISNVTIYGSGTKNINMFYKLQNGTIMNVNFDRISIENTNLTAGKQVGIIGDMQGGYVHNIHVTNINAYGKEGVGGIVGSITGAVNYISECSFDNTHISESEDTKGFRLAVKNKYVGGIVGNAQKNSDQEVLELHIDNCYSVGTIGDGQDAAGNTGGIIGRVKNETTGYKTYINKCYFKGYIVSTGQYNAGILGDLDNGSGYCSINNCYSEPIFIYGGVTLDARKADVEREDVQTYAHKNSNPIIGRAVLNAEVGMYECRNNYGTWEEYYSASAGSTGFCFQGFYGVNWQPKEAFFKNVLGWDVESVWNWDTLTNTITLR
jgi:hypothetical protein